MAEKLKLNLVHLLLATLITASTAMASYSLKTIVALDRRMAIVEKTQLTSEQVSLIIQKESPYVKDERAIREITASLRTQVEELKQVLRELQKQ